MEQSDDDVSVLRAVYRVIGLSPRELWLRYVALGGNADELSVDAQLHGVIALPPGEFNVLAHAVNEEVDDLPEAASTPRVPYKRVTADEESNRR